MSTERLLVSRPATLRIDLDAEGGAIYGTRGAYAALAASLVQAVEGAERSPGGDLIAKLDFGAFVSPDSDLPDFTREFIARRPRAGTP